VQNRADFMAKKRRQSSKRRGGAAQEREHAEGEIAQERDFAEGELLPTPQWWKDLARAEIKKQFGAQWRLAEKIGGSQAGVSMAINPDKQVSRYVTAMSLELGIPIPSAAFSDPDTAEFYAEAKDLTPEQKSALIKVMQATWKKGVTGK
jgi:hypothetical protein